MKTEDIVLLFLVVVLSFTAGCRVAAMQPKPPVIGLTVPCSLNELERRCDVVLSELRAIEGLTEAPAN